MVLIGSRTSITATALHYLTKHDVVTLAVDWRSVPFAGIYPWGDHGRVAARHLAQAALSKPRRKNAWMQLVKAKILGQAATLDPVNWRGADRLRELAKSVRSGDPANTEGTAARIYWGRLFPRQSGFMRRPESGDNLNGMLNYGYTVLRGYAIRAVVAAGLSPPLGVFHRGRANYFNLVDDLIEPFRPAVDWVVAELGIEADLESQEVRHTLVAAATQPFGDAGYGIPTVLESLAQSFGRYVEGEVARLKVPIWEGRVDPDSNRGPLQTGSTDNGRSVE